MEAEIFSNKKLNNFSIILNNSVQDCIFALQLIK